jgi:hypothetical protein
VAAVKTIQTQRETESAMAHLLYVPVVHSSAEMGSAASGYQAAFIARFGEQKWRERGDEYNAIWRAIHERIDHRLQQRGVALPDVKLYQDSLPVCGHEAALVTQLSEQGSENHKLLGVLMQRGAVLVGSESPELLLEEYRLLQTPGHTEAQAAALLEQRDRFIAQRIVETLGKHEFGILFIGALHRVHVYLPQQITVEYLPIERG